MLGPLLLDGCDGSAGDFGGPPTARCDDDQPSSPVGRVLLAPHVPDRLELVDEESRCLLGDLRGLGEFGEPGSGWVDALEHPRLRERDVVATVDQQRASLADLLEGLTDDEWATPSLCDGWTVREVVAHLTLTAIGPGRATIELIRYGGSLSRTARETARRRAGEMSSAELTERLRGLVGSRRHLLGTRYVDPLVDVLVHGQDIAVPLRRERAMPLEASVTAINRVATMTYWMGKRRRLRGLRLEATDAEWTWGHGPVVHGPVAVLLLLITGRRARLDELTGAGCECLVAVA